MYDIVALGELLVDFIQEGINEDGHPVFSANPGGAPCNMLAMATKMGKKTGFIGKVGSDSMGEIPRDAIVSCGIDDRGLCKDETVPTTLAFVSKTETGDRNFSFYRNPGADVMLCKSDVDFDMIKNSKIFHFGTLSMTHASVREATKKAIQHAKEHGCLVSFDPNIRELLWNSYYQDLCVEHKGCIVENVVDTTGAGDTFMGAALANLLEIGMAQLDQKALTEILHVANKAASLITMRKGALTVMPNREEIRC